MTNTIVVERLQRRYGAFLALNDVSFAVPRGAVCGLVGKNGAGKTTLLSILAGLDEDYVGEVRVCGVAPSEAPVDVKRRVGFVPDHMTFYDQLSVKEHLLFFAAAAGIEKRARAEAMASVVARTGLTDLVERDLTVLSKGQSQRLSVARALIHRPEVLILDEPASGLDPRARIALKELLKRLAREGVTVLISSHILTELGDFCDHLVLLEGGRLLKAGPLKDIAAETRGGSTHRLLIELDGDAAGLVPVLLALDGVEHVDVDGPLLSLRIAGDQRVHARIAHALVHRGVGLLSMTPERENLEALFLALTAKPSSTGAGA